MTFFEKLLNFYQIDDETLAKLMAKPSLDSLPKIADIDVLNLFNARIKKAIESHEKICVYGDYDCDGILASAILVATFKKLAYDNIFFYIPDRSKDGYGLTKENVQKMGKANFTLIITVDNGISAYEALEEAQKLGIDVLITDHHDLVNKNRTIEAYAILHPLFLSIDKYNFSGGFVALLLSAKLLGYYDDYLTALAAITVVSDMMPILGYNRELVKIGIQLINENRYSTIVGLLNDNNKTIDEQDFGSEIAPKINAMGRLLSGKPLQKIVTYFVTDDVAIQRKILFQINNVNDQRKKLTALAIEKITPPNKDDKAIVIYDQIEEGLLGLIANRLLHTYNLPVAVFTDDKIDSSSLKASIRTADGLDLGDFFTKNSDIFLRYGGHDKAAGLAINRDDINVFKERFSTYAKEHPFATNNDKYIEIDLRDISYENYQIVKQFKPFGIDFVEPTFLIKNIMTERLTYSKDERHLITQLSSKSKLLGFACSKEKISMYQSIDVVGKFRLAIYKMSETVEFNIMQIFNKKQKIL